MHQQSFWIFSLPTQLSTASPKNASNLCKELLAQVAKENVVMGFAILILSAFLAVSQMKTHETDIFFRFHPPSDTKWPMPSHFQHSCNFCGKKRKSLLLPGNRESWKLLSLQWPKSYSLDGTAQLGENPWIELRVKNAVISFQDGWG